MTGTQRAAPGSDATPWTRARFDEACEAAAVPDSDRDALWALVEGDSPARRSPDRVRSLVDDHAHWRLYLAARTGDDRAAQSFRRYWTRAASAYLGPHAPPAAVDELASAFF